MCSLKVLLKFFVLFGLAKSDQNFLIKSIDLFLNTNIHQGDTAFTANASIVIEMTESSENIEFHHRDLRNFNVSLENMIGDERKVNATEDVNVLKLRTEELKKSLQYTIRMSYEGSFQQEFTGHYFHSNDSRVSFLAISFSSSPFNSICPSIQGNIRVNFVLSIRHNINFHTFSYQPIRTLINDTSEFIVTKFDKILNILTSSIAIFISNFESTSNESVKIYEAPPQINEKYFDEALTISTQIVKKFEALFSNQCNLNQIAVPGILFNDISVHGLIMYNEFNVFYRQDLSPLEKKDKISHSIAFAVAQQYFGIITTTSWNDSFITEGLASFYEHFILSNEPVEHENHIMAIFTVEILQKAFEIDSSLLAEPLMTSKLIPADEFNSFTRSKASCIMRMMESVIGNETFTKGVKNLLGNFENKSIRLENLYAALQNAVNADGKNIKLQDFDMWITQRGYPLIFVEIIDNNKLRVSQESFGMNQTETLWKIPLTYMTSDMELHLKYTNQTEIIIDVSTDDWIIFNVDRVGYYRVNYDTILWNHLINKLKSGEINEMPTSNRAALINDAFSLALKNKISYSIALNLISYILREENLVPWKAAHEELKFLDAMLFNSQIYPMFKSFVVELITPFLTEALTSENHKLKSIILFWACQMKIEECTNFVTNLLPEYLQNPISFRPNDREMVLCNAIKIINQESAFDELVLKMMSIDGDRSEWISGLSCIEEGYWLTKFLLLAYNQELNLTEADRRKILIQTLKNHKYGTMAGVDLLARKTFILSEGEIKFILEEIVKRFWDRNLLTTFENTNLNQIEIYVNLAKDKLDWLSMNRDEIENWLNSWHETTIATQTTTMTSTEVMMTTTEETTTTTGRAALTVINPIIVLMIYGAINV